MITILIIHIACWILAAICDAMMDKISFHYEHSVFRRNGHETVEHAYFWDPQVSYLNKYKNRVSSNGPRFFGSTTVFVFLTDAFHLAQFLMNLFIIATLITGIYMVNDGLLVIHIDHWYAWVFLGLCYKAAYSSVFELFFSMIFEKGK